MSQIVQSQLTHAILSGNRIEFQRPRYTDSRELETAGNVTLPFEGWSMAMHPPSNVLVVSERTESVSYVASQRFADPCRATLTSYALV